MKKKGFPVNFPLNKSIDIKDDLANIYFQHCRSKDLKNFTAGQSQTLRVPLLFLAFAVWSLQAMFHLRLSRVCCADCAA
jgi:hypothetical protein